jgi:hypothetical protein
MARALLVGLGLALMGLLAGWWTLWSRSGGGEAVRLTAVAMADEGVPPETQPVVEAAAPGNEPVAAEVGTGIEAETEAEAEVDGLTVIAAETAMVVEQLFRENRALLDEVASLRSERDRLEQELAEARVQLDMNKVQAVRGDQRAVDAAGAPVAYDDITRLRVLDVNRDMQVVVLSGGQRAGLRMGMKLSVIRGEAPVAEVRLIDVRESFAGGLIEKVEKGSFPETGDRLILNVKQD